MSQPVRAHPREGGDVAPPILTAPAHRFIGQGLSACRTGCRRCVPLAGEECADRTRYTCLAI